MISGACGASMIGEKAGERAAISFLSPFLEAPRGLRTHLRATADARTPMTRGARGVHDAGVRVESLWRRSAECRPPSGEAWHWRSRGDRLTPERASRAPRHVRLVIVRRERLTPALGDVRLYARKEKRAGGTDDAAGAPELHGYEQSALRCCLSRMQERAGLRSRAGRMVAARPMRQSAARERRRLPSSGGMLWWVSCCT
jgi:hypothetical protein